MKFLRKNKTKILIGGIILALVFTSGIWEYFKNKVNTKESMNLETPTHFKITNKNQEEEVLFTACSQHLLNYYYKINVPVGWKVNEKEFNKYNAYFELSMDNKKLTISCTTEGVGGDICDDKYRVKFIVGNKTGEACYGQINGVWNMGVLNLPRDPSTQVVISFWADGIEPQSLKNILSSFKI